MLADLACCERDRRGLREVSPMIGISPATISRIERKVIPDMATFLTVCDWLEIHPIEFIRNTKHETKPQDYSVICSKLRADKRIDSNIGNAIASLIEAVFDN